MLVSFSGNAQEIVERTDVEKKEGIVVPKHELSLEHGYFNRGIVGVTYGRNFQKREKSYLSVSGGTGIGLYFEASSLLFDISPMAFFTVSPSYQFGGDNHFLSVGAELKSVQSRRAYSGFGVGAYAGYSFNGNNGFLFKLRMGATSWTANPDGDDYYTWFGTNLPMPMMGISFGFRIGDNL